MNQSQFNEAYKSKHMITTFTPAPPSPSTFVQATGLAEQHQSKPDQQNAKDGNNFSPQEDSPQPQQVTFNKSLVNVPKFETEYQDFAPFKRAAEYVFVGSWDLYTKQVKYNIITYRLQKYYTEKIATAATGD